MKSDYFLASIGRDPTFAARQTVHALGLRTIGAFELE
jgi:hypothetical protein